jgi:hypothetical protein
MAVPLIIGNRKRRPVIFPAGGYAINDTSWPEVQQVVLQPGNKLCGSVPPGFPAYKSQGHYLTGTYQIPLTNLGKPCSLGAEVVIDPTDYYGDHSGDSLSEAAVAGAPPLPPPPPPPLSPSHPPPLSRRLTPPFFEIRAFLPPDSIRQIRFPDMSGYYMVRLKAVIILSPLVRYYVKI